MFYLCNDFRDLIWVDGASWRLLYLWGFTVTDMKNAVQNLSWNINHKPEKHNKQNMVKGIRHTQFFVNNLFYDDFAVCVEVVQMLFDERLLKLLSFDVKVRFGVVDVVVIIVLVRYLVAKSYAYEQNKEAKLHFFN